MKRYVAKKEEVETTSEIGSICGFTTEDGLKGYLVYVGLSDDCIGIRHAVLVEEDYSVPNKSCGTLAENKFPSIEYFVENANNVFAAKSIGVRIKDIYFFDTLKEMHKWLSE